MFSEKPRRTYLSIIQNRTFSRSSPSRFPSYMCFKSTVKSTTQMRIIFYSKPARETSEKMTFLSLKCDLISQSSRREMRVNNVFKYVFNSNTQRYISDLPLIQVKNVSKKMSLSSHISLPSTLLYCRLKTSSSRLRCMFN